MNLLHTVVNDLENNSLMIGVNDYSDIQKAIDNMLAPAKNAIAFDLGECETIRHLNGDVPNLPYESCWFEMNDRVSDTEEQIRYGCLMWENSDQGKRVIDCACFVGKKEVPGRFVFIGGFLAWPPKRTDQEFKIEYMKGSLSTACNTIAGFALRGCLAMQCNNVIKIEKKPSKVAQMRAKKKKTKLFSTWTLHIKPECKEYETKGGTHASPRVHLRRGHVRQLKSGKCTWVQPCLVRGQSPGMVHKDYALCSA